MHGRFIDPRSAPVEARASLYCIMAIGRLAVFGIESAEWPSLVLGSFDGRP
jgi:hypothetical protein